MPHRTPDTGSAFWNEDGELVQDGTVIARCLEDEAGGIRAYYVPTGVIDEAFEILPHDKNAKRFADVVSARRSLEVLGKISLDTEL